ncbi:MAG: hypothetical protein JWO32_1742 [Bacteroidetes bacterium]|nr:hypothetical protein [Bacteroidota bacterium]
MIQRKQTLFLLQIAFLSICLLFIPLQYLTSSQAVHVSLIPLSNGGASSTSGHFAALGLNVLGLAIAIITIFLYKRRDLQVKLCYTLIVIYIILPLMFAFCPFIQISGEGQNASVNVFGYIVCAVNILSAYLAQRFVKKDIQLIKSSDRIR